MLDQNTDRMWFVIGAVIVGAAIIFIANGTLPDIFASVTATFEEQTSQTTDIIDWHSSNLIVPYRMTKGNMINTSTGKLSNSGPHAPRHATTDYISVEPGEAYTVLVPGHTHTTVFGFYDAEYNTISIKHTYNHEEFTETAPEGAAYVRVSNRVLDNGGVPIEEWWFGKDSAVPVN